MKPADLTPILLRCAALALLIGGVGWALAGLAGGWLGAEALGLTGNQMRAAIQPFLVLLILGLPGVYFGLRTGQGWLLLAGAGIAAAGLALVLLGNSAAYGFAGQNGDPGGEMILGIGTVVLGAGALVMSLGLIRQGGTAEWVPLLLAVLGLTVIPALLEARLAIIPGLCWAALGYTVWIAAGEITPSETSRR